MSPNINHRQTKGETPHQTDPVVSWLVGHLVAMEPDLGQAAYNRKPTPSTHHNDIPSRRKSHYQQHIDQHYYSQRSKRKSKYPPSHYPSSDLERHHDSDGYESSLDDVVYREADHIYHEIKIEQRPVKGFKSVLTYLLTGKPSDKQVAQLIKYFAQSEFFDLRVVDIAPPYSLPTNTNLTREQSIELFRYQYVLKKAAREDPKRNVLIVKDTSVATGPVEDLESAVKTACQVGDWDFFYLTRWLDLCDLYRNPTKVPGTMNQIVQTFSPNGNQALVFSPQGRDVFIGKRRMRNHEYFTPITVPLSTKLNEEITLENTKALAVIPNMLEFNVLEAETVSDLAKVCDCRRPETIEDDPSTNSLSILWFVVVILIVLALVWALYMVGPSKHRLERDKP